MPKIAVINESTALPDQKIKGMLPAFQRQWNIDLASVWRVEAAEFEFTGRGGRPPQGGWWLVFLDDSDQAEALAYHDLTNEGLPISKVFVKTLLADDASVSVGATHELCEMAVDPWLNGAYQDTHGAFWASEVCDPVEDDRYGYPIDGLLVTDFVTPAWFAHQHARGATDFKHHTRAPFELLVNGYAQKYDDRNGWVQVNGSATPHGLRALTAPRGSRRERRARQWRHWRRSEPHWTFNGRDVEGPRSPGRPTLVTKRQKR